MIRWTGGWMRGVVSAAVVALWAQGSLAHAEMVDRVAAVVNNDIVAFSEVEQRAAPELARVNSIAKTPEEREKLRNQVLHETLDGLIGDKLMEAQIKELQIDVSDAEVQAGIDDVKKANNFSDDAQLEDTLRQQGLTMASYKDFMKKHLAKLKLMNLKVRNKIKVSEQDLKAEYARYTQQESEDPEVHVRHIVVLLPKTATPEQVEKARLKAVALAVEARKPGVNFAELAKKKSEGPSAENGGDLGYFRHGVMLPEFEKTAFALKVGQVSEPVRTAFGWHVLKVEDRRAAATKPFDEVKDMLRDRLLKNQMDHYTAEYVKDLRQQATVDVKI